MVAMTTQRALLQFTALAALVLAPVAAARLIAPEGMWASEPYLELAHRDIPDLLAGVFHGGFSLKTPKNSSADKSQYIFVDYFAVDQMGKFWGMYKPIMSTASEVSGSYGNVSPIVEGKNYTVVAKLESPEKMHMCWVVTLKNHTKHNTTSQEGFGSFGKDCPENKTMAEFTFWLKNSKTKSDPELFASHNTTYPTVTSSARRGTQQGTLKGGHPEHSHPAQPSFHFSQD
eukprot:jgi/Tetstr1/465911/TSEL_010526.t1